jgi:hypothetical protein
MTSDERNEQLHLLEEHISQITEVISVLDDLSGLPDGHNRERIEELLNEFHQILASGEALLEALQSHS